MHPNHHGFNENESYSNTALPQSDSSGLTTTSPKTAVDLYIDSRRGEVSENTLQSHEYRLSHFIRWYEQNEREDTTELTGRDLYEYRIWRKNDGDLNTVSVRTQLSTLRTFIRFLETIEAATQGLHEKIVLPPLDDGEGVRGAIVSDVRATEILEYFRRYEYASRDHTLFEILWHIGCRIGEAHALDVDDFHPKNQSLDVKHRPKGSTPLKNKERGERPVSLSDTVTEVISDYIAMNRVDVEDEYSREPLFSSKHGRVRKTWLRRTVYRITQPCLYGPCPHDRVEQECEAKGYDDGAQCPSSLRPHDIRRGSITHFLNSDVPKEVVSDRMDVNKDALDKHYDKRSPDEKMELRRQYVDNV